MSMATDKELPILRAWYEFTVWLVPKIGKFPRDLRFTLGERVERRTFEILELLIQARYSKERLPLLERANVDLNILLYLLRAAHELKALPPKAYGDASVKLLEIGTQLGGWKKSSQSKGAS